MARGRDLWESPECTCPLAGLCGERERRREREQREPGAAARILKNTKKAGN